MQSHTLSHCLHSLTHSQGATEEASVPAVSEVKPIKVDKWNQLVVKTSIDDCIVKVCA